MKIKQLMRYLLLIMLIISNLGMIGRKARIPRYIRVAIIKSAGDVGLRVIGDYILTTLSGKQNLYRVPSDTWISFKAQNKVITVGKNVIRHKAIRLKNGGNGRIVLQGKELEGDLFIYLKKNKKLLVVNRVLIEEYIRGVLPFEMSPESPLEALKAQAVAARTYAYYKIMHPQTNFYALTDDSSSQVYGGNAKHSSRIDKAVRTTKGMIMTFKGKPFLAFYHTSCGGMTNKANTVWKNARQYPRNTRCPYCMKNPKKWRVIISFYEIARLFRNKGYNVGKIKKIVVSGKNRKSKKVSEITLFCTRGRVRVPAIEFRNVVGVNKIKSAQFRVKNGLKKALFEGEGWGHGVGMCQRGAIGMARDGYSYKKILKRYYPGMSFKKI